MAEETTKTAEGETPKVTEAVVVGVDEGKGKSETVVTVHEPVPQPVQQDNSIESFISQAIAQKLPIETMEKFLAMRKEFRLEQAREAFVMSMASFQKECPVIAKTKVVKNKEGKEVYKYAPLDSIVLQVKTPLGNNNLAYSFKETRSEDGKTLTAICTIRHSLGHSEDSTFTVDVGTESFMTDTQKYGARMTFAKRYAFCNALGILTGDEDTDARELTIKPKALNPALNPKARVVALLRTLGVKDTTNPEATREKILELTQLTPDTPANIEEIISRLEVLIQEKNESQ